MAQGKVNFVKGQRDLVYAIIPARSGSTAIKGKNLKDFMGKPLMAWQIENAVKAKNVDRVFLTTDSEEYAEIGRKYGAELPNGALRPKAIAGSLSTDFEFMVHFLQELEKGGITRPDYIVQLRPTAPMTSVEDVEKSVELMKRNELFGYDSLRSVTEYDHEAYNSYWVIPDEGLDGNPIIIIGRY